MARGGNLAAVNLADVGDEIGDMRHIGLQPVPFEHPGPDPRLGRQAFEHFQLLLRAGDVKALVETELNRLLQCIDHVLTGSQENNHIRIGSLCLDQVSREIGGAERRQGRTDFSAAELSLDWPQNPPAMCGQMHSRG